MSTSEDAESFVAVSQHSGAVVARLASFAVESAAWPKAQERLKSLLLEASAPVVIDCRDLRQGASEIVAPLLYDLLVAGRRQAPRVEIGVVGKPEQSIGASSAFLLPTRFETIEQAVEALTERRTTRVPLKISPDNVADNISEWDRPRFSFWQSASGQILLTILVAGLTFGLVGYSASVSFSKPTLPRRHGTEERDARIVIQGNVQRAEGRALSPDHGAVVLAWPNTPPVPKFKLTAAQLFDVPELPVLASLVIVQTTGEGRYAIHQAQLPQPTASYRFLAISKTAIRDEPPDQSTLTALEQFFEDPRQLLGDRRYASQELFVDVNVTKDQNFVFAGL